MSSRASSMSLMNQIDPSLLFVLAYYINNMLSIETEQLIKVQWDNLLRAANLKPMENHTTAGLEKHRQYLLF